MKQERTKFPSKSDFVVGTLYKVNPVHLTSHVYDKQQKMFLLFKITKHPVLQNSRIFHFFELKDKNITKYISPETLFVKV